jgi:DNA-binding NtrC family response regulator
MLSGDPYRNTAMGKLAISLGSLPVLAVEIGESTIRIGRSHDNDIVLPLPDVADVHAEVRSHGEICEVTAVEGESLHRAGRPVPRADLVPGDQIDLGCYRLRWLASQSGRALSGPTPVGARSHGTKPLEQPMQRGGRRIGLEVMDGAERGVTVDLETAAIVVGRAPECDLVLTDDAVSWRHCSVEIGPAGVRVRDLDSHNGTFLDGSRIESATAEAGSRIQVGLITLRLVGASDEQDLATRGFAEFVGRSAPMREVYERIREAATGRMPVLLLGETGTGKELAARAIHSVGPRSHGPFVPVNCAAIPRDLLEDELFGHVSGAYTGATGDRAGAFERADGGSVFLDEVGELAPELQAKLLRVLDDGRIPRLGGAEVTCDVRVVAATNCDLAAAVAVGRFRQDLYYRLAVVPIRMPPLRDRLEDLPDLIAHFLDSAEEHTGVAGAARIHFAEDAIHRLSEHGWPGNVRELRNVVLRGVVEVKRGAVDRQLADRLLAELGVPAASVHTPPRNLQEIERETIRRALEDSGGQRRAAARRLGIAESTLYEKIKRYGLADVRRPVS